MRLHFLGLLLAVATTLGACAQGSIKSESTAVSQPSCEQLRKTGATADQLVQRGCCSHHSGVCGCSRRRVVCCDNSYSPSCLCNQDDPKGVVN